MEMLQELKKRSLKKSLLSTIIVLAIGVALALMSFDGIFDLIKGPKTLDDIPASDIKSQYVESDVYVVMDCFAEYVTKNTKTNVETTDWLYYVIPVGEEEYMAVRVKPKVGRVLDDICDDTWSYLGGELTELTNYETVTGKIRKMKDKELDHYYDWFTEAGFSQAEIDQYALPYVIQDGMVGGAVFSAGVPSSQIFFAAAAMFFLIWAILRIVKAMTGGYQGQIKKFIKNHPETGEAQISADYASARNVNGMRIGKLYTIYNDGPKTMILKNTDIAWAYLQRTTHKRNGVHTGTTYAVILKTMNKKTYTVGLNNEDSVMQVLDEYSVVAPNVVLGYSDDLKKAYNKDINEFVRMGQQMRADAEARAEAARAEAARAQAEEEAAQTTDNEQE